MSTKSNASSVSEFNCALNAHKPKISGTPNIKIVTSLCRDYVFTHESMRQALSIFVREYAVKFDMTESEVWVLISNLEIEVSAIPKVVSRVYDGKGNFLEGPTPVSGLALSEHKIWLEVKTSKIWASSLAHELIHIIIWRSQGVHADPDHEGVKFSGWTKKHTSFISEYKQLLIDLDL
jgi:hypothetical protein